MYFQQHEKMMNRDKVLATLFEHRQLTKLEISRITNLSIPTVTSNITSLMEDGLVDEAGVANSTGDRKSTRLNSSHVKISYAVFCLKKKTRITILWLLPLISVNSP